MQVIALDRAKKETRHHRMALGRQSLQVAALISAQLPDQREDAIVVLDQAVKIVREWLESGPSATLPAEGRLQRLSADRR